MERTLHQLRPGETGVVDCVRGEEALRVRLYDMGLTPGATVQVVRRAPLGDPVQIRLRGYGLTLRRSAAQGVILRAKERLS